MLDPRAVIREAMERSEERVKAHNAGEWISPNYPLCINDLINCINEAHQQEVQQERTAFRIVLSFFGVAIIGLLLWLFLVLRT